MKPTTTAIAASDDAEYLLSEDAMLLLGLAGSAVLGGILSKIAIGGKRAIQAALATGKESAVEKAMSGLSAADAKKLNALLDAETRRLTGGQPKAPLPSRRRAGTRAMREDVDEARGRDHPRGGKLIRIGYGTYNVFQRYWEGQGDDLYAVLSRRGTSVDWVTLRASRSEVERLKEVAQEIIDTSDDASEVRVAKAFLQDIKKPVREDVDESKGTVRITVKKKDGEWAAVYYLNGKQQEGPTYYAGGDDREAKQDAESTAKAMRKQAKAKGFTVQEDDDRDIMSRSIVEAESEEELDELELGLDELECLVMADLSDALSSAIAENGEDVHKVGTMFGDFEEAVRCGNFEKAELLFEAIVEVLPLDEFKRMTTASRMARLRSRRRGVTQAVKTGAKSKGEVRRENRLRRMARRRSPTSRMKEKRQKRKRRFYDASRRSLSMAKESLDEARLQVPSAKTMKTKAFATKLVRARKDAVHRLVTGNGNVMYAAPSSDVDDKGEGADDQSLLTQKGYVETRRLIHGYISITLDQGENIAQQAMRQLTVYDVFVIGNNIRRAFKFKTLDAVAGNVHEGVDEAATFIAIFNGKKIEFEAKDLYAAKLHALKELKVPKSKAGLLALMNKKSYERGDFRYEDVDEASGDLYVVHDGIKKLVITRDEWKRKHRDFKSPKAKISGKTTRAMLRNEGGRGTVLAPVYVDGLDKGGVPVSECVDEARKLRIRTQDPMEMRASQINTELGILDNWMSERMTAMIEAGRGHEKFSEIAKAAKAKDELAMEIMAISARQDALREEGKARYGPKLIGRLPLKGFGPRKKRVREDVDEAGVFGFSGRDEQWDTEFRKGPRRPGTATTGETKLTLTKGGTTYKSPWLDTESISQGNNREMLVWKDRLREAAKKYERTGKTGNAMVTVESVEEAQIDSPAAGALYVELRDAYIDAGASQNYDARSAFTDARKSYEYREHDSAVYSILAAFKYAKLKVPKPLQAKAKKLQLESEGLTTDQAAAVLLEVSPPGWEERVKKMKRDPDIDNPWQLAWYLYNKQKGKKSKKESTDESLRPGHLFVLVDTSVPGGRMVGDFITGSKAADKKAAKLRKTNPKIQVIDALWYGPSREKLIASGTIAEMAAEFHEDGDISVHQTPEEVSEVLNAADKKVVQAFVDKKPLEGKRLSTDGQSLDWNGMGGRGVATWGGGKIQMGDTGSSKDGEAHRAIRKAAPKNWIVEDDLDEYGRGYGRRSRSYGGDPRWITARRPGKDMHGRAFKKGDEVLYYPNGKQIISDPKKAEAAWREFLSMKGDEEGMPYADSIEDPGGPSIAEASGQYKTLNDAASIDGMYAAGRTEIWYMRDDTARVYGMGLDFIRKHNSGAVPTKATYKTTHKLLGKVKETHPERVFGMMQGERWSPDGEARTMLGKLGIHHTSMSVGDIIKTGTRVLFVDRNGFTPLD
jgi:hypothetical protein